MRITTMISILQSIKDKHGDVAVMDSGRTAFKSIICLYPNMARGQQLVVLSTTDDIEPPSQWEVYVDEH